MHDVQYILYLRNWRTCQCDWVSKVGSYIVIFGLPGEMLIKRYKEAIKESPHDHEGINDETLSNTGCLKKLCSMIYFLLCIAFDFTISKLNVITNCNRLHFLQHDTWYNIWNFTSEKLICSNNLYVYYSLSYNTLQFHNQFQSQNVLDPAQQQL